MRFNDAPKNVPAAVLRAWIASHLHADADESDVDSRADDADAAGLDSEAVEAARCMVRARRGLPERARQARGQQGEQGQGQGNGRGGRP